MENEIDIILNKLLKNVGDMSLKRRSKMMIKALDLKKGEKVLDVGCGDGFFSYLLYNLGLNLKMVGIDFDKEGLANAKKNLSNTTIKFVHADLMGKIPFENNTFDNAVMSEVAEHLPDDKKGFKEIFRVLKPGAKLALSVPNSNYPFLWDPVNWLLEKVFNTHIKSGFWAGIWNEHIRLYSSKQIENVVKSAGFKVEKVECPTYFCLPFNHYLLNLAARMLYSGHMATDIAKQISKFKTAPKRKFYINFLFWFVNFVDKLNEGRNGKSSSNIIVIASK